MQSLFIRYTNISSIVHKTKTKTIFPILTNHKQLNTNKPIFIHRFIEIIDPFSERCRKNSPNTIDSRARRRTSRFIIIKLKRLVAFSLTSLFARTAQSNGPRIVRTRICIYFAPFMPDIYPSRTNAMSVYNFGCVVLFI